MKWKAIVTRFSIIGALLLTSTHLPSATYAASTTIWTGPGQMACRGHCSLEWALSQLSAAEREAVQAAMELAPLGYSIPIRDGALFSMMSYFDEEAVADMRTTVAVLEADEPAIGWKFDGWSFVQISGCQNWAVLINLPSVHEDHDEVFPLSKSTGASATPTASTPSLDFQQMSGIILERTPRLSLIPDEVDSVYPERQMELDVPDLIPREDQTTPTFILENSQLPKSPAIVPLPWSIHLILLSLLTLRMVRLLDIRNKCLGHK